MAPVKLSGARTEGDGGRTMRRDAYEVGPVRIVHPRPW
jgi:hypothetical protein